MKFIIILFFSILYNTCCCSQQLDQSISEMANDLAQKVSKKNKLKLALTDFTNSEGKSDALTTYIRDELELKLINTDYNLQVVDRKHIKLLLSEHHLQSEGLIDESIAKSAIAFIKVDGWVIAEITNVDDQIKIKVTVTDVATSLMYAASTTTFITDPAIQKLLASDIKVCSDCGGKGILQSVKNCSSCNGAGSYDCTGCKGIGKVVSNTWSADFMICKQCDGIGKIDCKACSGFGKLVSYIPCSKCNGKEVPATLRKKPGIVELCDKCLGNGRIKTHPLCQNCNGTGQNPLRRGTPYVPGLCNSCSGTGKIISFVECTKCNGTGKL